MAKDFFDFLWEARGGIVMFLLCLFAAGALVQWGSWIFRLGRFKASAAGPAKDDASKISFVIVRFFVQLINNFRHFLALVLVLIFAAVLFGAIVVGRHSTDDLTKCVQAVMATLGGLIGSIVGYYFGESAARSGKEELIPNEAPEQTITAGSNASPMPLTSATAISPAATPPGPRPSTGAS